MLVDIFLPTHTVAVVQLLASALLVEPGFADWSVARPSRCPADMVLSGSTCVDVFPWPNTNGDEVLLGASALPEAYLDLRGETWDCEALCASKSKRLCSWSEWQAACDGTPADACGGIKNYRNPDWYRVMRRDRGELQRLDQRARASEAPACTSKVGARLMTTVEEWVTVGREGHAFSRGFWSRAGGCSALNTTHAANWHDYATSCRCCKDALP